MTENRGSVELKQAISPLQASVFLIYKMVGTLHLGPVALISWFASQPAGKAPQPDSPSLPPAQVPRGEKKQLCESRPGGAAGIPCPEVSGKY